MIPVKDSIESISFPWVNYGIIGINIVVFIFELLLTDAELEEFIYSFALIPAEITVDIFGPSRVESRDYLSFINSMFLHGGWFHIIGNMWTLWIFGDNVEDRLGKINYLILYFFSGIFASIMHIISDPLSEVPIIGASGAVSGVMGAYFYLYPGAKVLVLIPILFIPLFFEIPAFIYLAFWFFQQTFNATLSLAIPNFSSIAWWAHIGGFIFGYTWVRLFFKRRRAISLWYYY